MRYVEVVRDPLRLIKGSIARRLKVGYFRVWHETVMPVLSPQVRCEAVNGPSSVAIRGPSLIRNGPRAAVAEVQKSRIMHRTVTNSFARGEELNQQLYAGYDTR
jgi:hypothetical protein